MPATNRCTECSATYELTGENAAVFIFLTAADANHLDTTCPECGTNQYIFLVVEGVQPLLETGLPLKLIPLPPNAGFQALADTWWDKPKPAPAAPPRESLVQLFDTLRHFDRPRSPDCGDACAS